MQSHLAAVLFTAFTVLPTLSAQKATGGPDPDRRATTLFVSADDSTTLAGVAISYSGPVWRDAYDVAVDKPQGTYSRLGKGWWTTLDTVGAIEIGGTKIEAGSYYLGLGIAKGAFTLLVFDSKQAMKDGLLPANTLLYRGEVKAAAVAPMTLHKGALAQSVTQMEIAITADDKDPSRGTLAIRWGKHELSAEVKFELAPLKSTVKK